MPEGRRLLILAREEGMLDDAEARALAMLGLERDLRAVAGYIKGKGA